MTEYEIRLTIKDEMKNRISMALKDPILQQCFEIICKNLSELEQENAELKETCNKWFEHLKNREEELLNELYNQNAKYESQIAELEKENAELKEKLKPENCLRYLAKGGYVEFFCENVNEHKQLTKAKEIIKTFLGFAEEFGYSPSMDKFITEAEQFLNSEVEK